VYYFFQNLFLVYVADKISFINVYSILLNKRIAALLNGFKIESPLFSFKVVNLRFFVQRYWLQCAILTGFTDLTCNSIMIRLDG